MTPLLLLKGITFEKLILMSKSKEGGQSGTVQEENDSKDI